MLRPRLVVLLVILVMPTAHCLSGSGSCDSLRAYIVADLPSCFRQNYSIEDRPVTAQQGADSALDQTKIQEFIELLDEALTVTNAPKAHYERVLVVKRCSEELYRLGLGLDDCYYLNGRSVTFEQDINEAIIVLFKDDPAQDIITYRMYLNASRLRNKLEAWSLPDPTVHDLLSFFATQDICLRGFVEKPRPTDLDELLLRLCDGSSLQVLSRNGRVEVVYWTDSWRDYPAFEHRLYRAPRPSPVRN